MSRRKIDLTKTRLRGVPEAMRHRYVEVEALGYLCVKCGAPKPRLDEQEQPCGGVKQVADIALRLRRERSIPNLLLAWSWVRMLKERGCQMDPGVIKANSAACRQPFVGLDAMTFQEQLQRSNADAKVVYQAVSADTDSRVHCLGVAMLCHLLVDGGLLDEPQNQAVLTSLVLLDEAEKFPGDWGYVPGTIQPLAEQMLQRARTLGYYGASIRSF